MGYSSGGGSSSTSVSIPPLGTGRTRALGKQLVSAVSPFFFGGDLTSPVPRMLSLLAYGKGQQEAQLGRKRIAETRGLSSPTKASMMGDLEGEAIRAAAAAPLSVYEWVGEALKGLLQPTQLAESSTAGSTKYGL